MDEVQKLKEDLQKSRALNAHLSDTLEEIKSIDRMPKNMDFVQLARSEMRQLAELGEQNSLSLKIFMSFGQIMNKQNAVMISYKAMERLFGKSRATIDRALKVLRNESWIKVVKVGTANAYILNPSILWADKNDKRGLCEFQASVVTTLDEQDKDLRKALLNDEEIKLRNIPSISNSDRIALDNENLTPPDQGDLELD